MASIATAAGGVDLENAQKKEFIPNCEYTKYIPKDLNFEDTCYRFAILKQPMEKIKNEALAEALELAEEASRAKTAFLSNMSHEIRTPMNAIIGMDRLALRDESLNSRTRKYLEKIGSNADHLLELINDILDMNRIESGSMVLQREEFSFSSMLEQINLTAQSQCRDKGLNYDCTVLNSVDEAYIGDAMKLKEALLNILSNAIKFTDAPGSEIVTKEPGLRDRVLTTAVSGCIIINLPCPRWALHSRWNRLPLLQGQLHPH